MLSQDIYERLSPSDITACGEIARRLGPDAADREAKRLAEIKDQAPIALEPIAPVVRWPTF